jgi:hypothetical protein
MPLPNDYQKINLLTQSQLQTKVNRYIFNQQQLNKKTAAEIAKRF